MKFKPPPTTDVPHVNVLLYGPPKTGKTAGACSAPGSVLLLNADLPNATRYARSRRDSQDLREIEYEGFATVVEIAKMANGHTFPEGVETVVIDPVNELYRRVLEELSQRAISPTLPTYQATGVHLERFFRALCECSDVNVVLVCHELPIKDEATDTVERLPATGTSNPALGQKLMGMVDIVGYCGVVEREDAGPEYGAQLINAGGRRGGDRFDVLGSYRPLDLTAWFNLMGAATAPDDSGATPEKE